MLPLGISGEGGGGGIVHGLISGTMLPIGGSSRRRGRRTGPSSDNRPGDMNL